MIQVASEGAPIAWVGALAEGLSSSHVVAFVFLILVGTGMILGWYPRGLRELRGIERFDPDPEPAWWPFGDQLWRGLERGGHLVSFVGAPLAVVAPLYFLVNGTSGQSGVVVALLAWILIGLLGGIVCILFNRPQFLVAASMRDDPGAVPVWLARDRDRGRRLAHLALPSALVMFVAGWAVWDPISGYLGAALVVSAILLVLEVGRALDAEPPDAAPTGSTSDESS